MVSEYQLKTTSSSSIEVEDLPLADEEELAGAVTRKILRSQLVRNLQDADSPVKICIMHQRRGSKNTPWQDVDSFDLRRLHAGEQVKLDLSCDETLRLHRRLSELYAATSQGLPVDQQRLRVSDPSESVVVSGQQWEFIRRLVEQEGEQFWEAVADLSPGLVETVARAKVHRRRQESVERFAWALEEDAWSEVEWDHFFHDNIWIFGYGLDYQFLSQVQNQAHLGGTTMAGTGGQRLDFIMATQATAKFTVLVDIKKPDSQLVGKEYRNNVHLLGEEIVGGVAQLQSYCRRWVVEGSRQEDNSTALQEAGIYTYEPRGILVVGQTKQLDNPGKKATFELFRRNLHNPTVLTYDELLERAKFVGAADGAKREEGLAESVRASAEATSDIL